MKRFLVFAFLVIIFIALFGVAGFSWWKKNIEAPSGDTSSQRFVITKGKSASEIGEMLYGDGLIRNPLAFKFYVQISNKAKKIQAGEYTLSRHFTLAEIIEKLVSGPDELWITIPEGLRREEIVERFISVLRLDSESASVFRQQFLQGSEGQEGVLFPDTYLFPRNVIAQVVVDKMLKTFDSQYSVYYQVLLDEEAAGGLDNNGIITLASILERETKTDEERPIVAGILLKRLDAGWPLQVDATVQYGLATSLCKAKIDCNWWPNLNSQDLEINSPYNSYKFAGLPPSPIANPGLSSINAVVYPETSDYWFYLHDASGNIHYAQSLDGHNANVRRYLGK